MQRPEEQPCVLLAIKIYCINEAGVDDKTMGVVSTLWCALDILLVLQRVYSVVENTTCQKPKVLGRMSACMC